MELPKDNCIEWCKLENVNAEIGEPLTDFGGVDFTKPGQFNNGAYTNLGTKSLGIADGNMLRPFNPNRFVFTFYIRPDFNVVNGVPDNGKSNACFMWWVGSTNLIFFSFDNDGGPPFDSTRVRIRVSGVSSDYFNTSANMNMTAGALSRFTLIYDRGGIGGGADKLRMYLGKINVFSSAVTPANQANTGTCYFMANAPFSNSPLNGLLDNIKISDDNGTGSISEELVLSILNNDKEAWPISYIIPNKFNRVAGLNMGRPL